MRVAPRTILATVLTATMVLVGLGTMSSLLAAPMLAPNAAPFIVGQADLNPCAKSTASYGASYADSTHNGTAWITTSVTINVTDGTNPIACAGTYVTVRAVTAGGTPLAEGSAPISADGDIHIGVPLGTAVVTGAVHHYVVLISGSGNAVPTPSNVGPPDAVTALAADPSELNQITVSWTKSTDDWSGGDVTDYRIMRDSVLVATVPAGTVSYTDPGLADGRAYLYQVVAVDSGGQYGFSAQVTALTRPGPVTACPTLDAYNSATASFTATFPTVTGVVTGYQVLLDGVVTTTGTASPITVTNPTKGTVPAVTVRAVNASGVGTASCASTVVVASCESIGGTVSFPTGTTDALSVFTSNGSFTVYQPTPITYLVVGGGGGGGGAAANTAGGGGGAGQVVSGSATIPAGTYTFTRGSGGAGGTGGTIAGATGGASTISAPLSITAAGGGGGAAGKTNTAGGAGASGGGGAGAKTGSTVTGGGATGGNAGGNGVASGRASNRKGGGGGGSSALGTNGNAGGTGGAGTTSTISGFAQNVGGGGGGGGQASPASGSAGGGTGGTTGPGLAATANSGSGGGGAGRNATTAQNGGNGAAGVIRIRYSRIDPACLSGLPSVPRTFTVANSAGKAQLSWTAPLVAGTPAFTVYTISHRDNPLAPWVTDTAVPAGTLTYTYPTASPAWDSADFQITATSATGNSPAAQILRAVQPALAHGSAARQFTITNYDPAATYTATRLSGSGTATLNTASGVYTLSAADARFSLTAQYPGSSMSPTAYMEVKTVTTYLVGGDFVTTSYVTYPGAGGPFGGSGFNATTSCTYHPPPADDTGCSFGYTNPVTSAVSPTPAGYTYSYGEWWRVT